MSGLAMSIIIYPFHNSKIAYISTAKVEERLLLSKTQDLQGIRFWHVHHLVNVNVIIAGHVSFSKNRRLLQFCSPRECRLLHSFSLMLSKRLELTRG
jgi:hypothetical protein